MAGTRSAKEIADAVQSLFRIRAAESDPDEQGLRTVWHQGTRGADLVSHVNAQGKVSYQELTLFRTFIEWKSGRGIRTGYAREEGGGGLRAASTAIYFDEHVMTDRIAQANAALSTYSGDDRYILHIKNAVAMAQQGLEMREEQTVTRTKPPRGPKPGPPDAAAEKRGFLSRLLHRKASGPAK